jgi:DNA polymerase V
MFALVDCNNFYTSCERLFRPDLKGKPVVVLSNNDGCIISRSAEAKAIGVEMGTPTHEVIDFLKQHNVQMCSSNYALYADLSERVMESLRILAPKVEVYSIDEAFLDLQGLACEPDLSVFGLNIKNTVYQWVGLPVCVGIGPSKTLAKLANRAAKKSQNTSNSGVVDLSCANAQLKLLGDTPVADIWGVGSRTAQRLLSFNINTALDLRNAPKKFIRKQFSVVIERIALELGGISCSDLSSNGEARQKISCSRSFAKKLDDINIIRLALNNHTLRAIKKLNSDGSLAKAITVSIKTNPFSLNDAQYSSALSAELSKPTNSPASIIKLANHLLECLWRDGFEYHKVSISLHDLTPIDCAQYSLFNAAFDESGGRSQVQEYSLNNTITELNKQSENVITVAAALPDVEDKAWQIQRNSLSPAYTTQWSDIVLVN